MWERKWRKHEVEGRDEGGKDKWKWVDWQPRVSLLIYQQHAWQPPGSKWMCTPQCSELLLSNGDKEQKKKKRRQEGGRGEYAQSKWGREGWLLCLLHQGQTWGKIHSTVTVASICQVSFSLYSTFHAQASSVFFTVKTQKTLNKDGKHQILHINKRNCQPPIESTHTCTF